jgi:hypothetical protein
VTQSHYLAVVSASICWLSLSSAFAATLPAASFREVLAEFETGAMTPVVCEGDHKIGRNKEISRFQILPAIWQQYSRSRDYRNPSVAWSVAERILCDRLGWFRQATGRDWDHVDLYLMWNAPGAYALAKFDRRLLPRTLRERAERFANLAAARLVATTRLAGSRS